MAVNLGDFHFLRPWWLLLLVPLWFILRRGFAELSPWQKLVDPHLLPYLLKQGDNEPKKWAKTLPYLFSTLIVLALAGPTAYKLRDEESLNKRPLFFLLELSEHMTANDVSPSRLKRALYKISDVLDKENAPISVIAFAGDAHVIVPLTSDDATIKELLRSISPDTMPLKGVRLKPALALLDTINLGLTKSSVVIITSSNVADFDEAKPLMSKHDLLWWVFATPQGAPILGDRGEFKKDPQGNVLVSKLDGGFKDKVSSIGGTYLPLSDNDKDVDAVVTFNAFSGAVANKQGIVFDTWVDLGPYLLIIAFLVFIILVVRVKPWWLFGILLIGQAHEGHSAGFLDYFLRSDQQAFQHLLNKEYDEAAKKYNDLDAKGAAFYEGKKYDEAIKALKDSLTSDGQYNLGNAYAQKGQLDHAIKAYDSALRLNPKNEDAAFNKALIEKLKNEQEQKNQDKNQEQNNDQNNDQQKKDEQQKPEDKQQEQDKPSEPKSNEKKDDKKPDDRQQKGQNKPSESKPDEKKEDKTPEPVDKSAEAKEEHKKEEAAQKPIPKEAPPPLSPREQYLLDQVKEHNQGQYLKRKFLEETRRKNAS